MSKPVLMRRARKVGVWAAGLLVVYSLLGFVLAPWLIERQLVTMLQERASVQVLVEDIRLNPFALTFAIDGLDTIDADGRRLISLESGFVNLQLNSIINRAWSLRELHLRGLHASLRRYDEVDSNIARVARRWSESAPSVTEPEVQEEAPIPRVTIADLRIDEASVAITDDVPAIPFYTSVDSLNFSVQNLTTLPDSEAGQTLSLTMGNGSRVDWSGELSLSPLRSEGEISLRGPYPDLIYSYFREQIPVRLSDGWFEADLDYTFALTAENSVDLLVSNLSATLSDLRANDVESGALLARLPLIAINDAALNLAQRELTVDSINLGAFEFHPERASDGSINFLQLLPPTQQSEVGAADVPSAATESAWQLQVAQLTADEWSVHVTDHVPIQPVSLVLDFSADITGISNQPNIPMTVALDASLSSGGTFNVSGALNVLPQLLFDGRVAVDAVALPVVQPYIAPIANISVDEGRFALAGDVTVAPGDFLYEGALSLDDLAITDTLERESLLGLGAVRVESAVIRAGQQTSVNIGMLRIQEPYARVEIAEDSSTNIGRLLVQAEIVDADATPAPSPDSPSASAPLPAIVVESIRVDEASADFSDLSLPLPFAVHMANLRGEISALSTNSSEPARVNLEGQVDEFGLVTISGQLRPLDPAQLTQLELLFRNLDIPSMSPYVIKFAGRRIDDGRLDVDLSYRISDSQLSGNNALVLRDLELGERVPHPDAMDLPLGLAVALLKDRNGVIDLEVPVTGDLNNPQFDYGVVIRRAVADIITNIVAAPFRFLAGLVGGADDEDMGIVGFLPGRADLAPPEREKLVKLASALVERPQLRLSVAGPYERAEDTAVLQEQYLARRIAMETALATQNPDRESGVVSRATVLEGIYRAAQSGGAEGQPNPLIDEFLTALRIQHTRAETESTPAVFDELAYAEALRRELLPLETITTADLEGLASVRASAIARQLAQASPELAERIAQSGTVAVTGLSRGWINSEMELTAN